MKDYESIREVQRVILSLQLALNKRSSKTMLRQLKLAIYDLGKVIERLEQKSGGVK